MNGNEPFDFTRFRCGGGVGPRDRFFADVVFVDEELESRDDRHQGVAFGPAFGDDVWGSRTPCPPQSAGR